ncbi:MAG: hypothetical protein GXP25_05485 [Planctomycetes bacterium]|nr:hypothetical protein [Planctomycetota bacterium]
MRRVLFLLVLIVAGCAPDVKEPQVIDPAAVDFWFGEDHKNGACWGEVAPAPGIPEKYSLKMTFVLKKNKARDWIDYRLRPLPNLDWSAHDTMYLYIYPEQTFGGLHLKIVDPDVPNTNHSVYEAALLRNEKPLPARQWTEIEVPLRPEKKYRDNISYLGFYVSCSADLPTGREFVFYVGIFDKPALANTFATDATPFDLKSTPVLEEDFEGGVSNRWQLSEEAKITKAKPEIVSGGASVMGDSRESDGQWHQFLETNPKGIKLKPGGTYLVSFDYKVLASLKTETDFYYFMLRTPAGIEHDVGWQRWRDAAGMSGARQAIVTLGDFPDYHLVFGIRGKGAIAIDNIKLSEIQNASE